MENENQTQTDPWEPYQIKTEFNTNFQYLEFDATNRTVIMFSDYTGHRNVHEFKYEDRAYKKIGLVSTKTGEDGKPIELIIPITVYSLMVELREEYPQNLDGAIVKRSGTGRETRYTVLPYFGDMKL